MVLYFKLFVYICYFVLWDATLEARVQGFREASYTTSRPSNKSECGIFPTSCPATKYRSYDGSCNNLKNPHWGTPYGRYERLLPSNYADDYSEPTESVSGKPLPNARIVSSKIYPEEPREDKVWTLNTMQFGQSVAHDMSHIYLPNISCCAPNNQMLSEAPENCISIEILKQDTVYYSHNWTCISITRTITDKDIGCMGERTSVDQISDVNSYLDLSTVYGQDEKTVKKIRSHKGGRLESVMKNGEEMLPAESNSSCTTACPNEPCYSSASDQRINQNPQLTLIHTIYVREHNRLADRLKEINPGWSDECIYQEARKINIAQHQHISYYEWLPTIIGRQRAFDKKLIYDTCGYVDDYNPKITPMVFNEHAHAAFRYFHTQIAGYLNLVDEARNTIKTARLSDWFNRPGILEQKGAFDALARGLNTQAEMHSDAFHDEEITKNLFRIPGQNIGADLKAICIQRTRDHGLACYNDVREFCGLPRARKFKDFLDVISEENVKKLKSLYLHPDDVELTVGGSLEDVTPGKGQAGPTFLCILERQFYKTRVADRFWFENSGEQGFTLAQLQEIKKSSISRLFCDNTNIKSMQPQGFRRINPTNKVVSCNNLPSVDLTLWRDDNNTWCPSTNNNVTTTAPSTTTTSKDNVQKVPVVEAPTKDTCSQIDTKSACATETTRPRTTPTPVTCPYHQTTDETEATSTEEPTSTTE
ncbi:unnamed protein product [Ceutorhynchus assimilis]|uniref:Peroxidase n=1 Tax=Ceutorhynchus assimilis TaxID=467358 RepID=A0A9N9QRV2_9CUCU|nr:unnamed protein product [Ceutorhynchus assimilis]